MYYRERFPFPNARGKPKQYSISTHLPWLVAAAAQLAQAKRERKKKND
jgi:hypothetical protein